MRNYHIPQTVMKIVYSVVVFFVFLVIISTVFNQGNTDMTMTMYEATYPTVSFSCNDYLYNTMHGYSSEMNFTQMKEAITPLQPGRKLSLYIDTYSTAVSGVKYELRNIEGDRLIENSEVYNYLNNDGIITADITFKDLIDENKEYSLCIILTTLEGEEIRYYARIVENDDLNLYEKLDFAYYFSKTTFDKAGASEELKVYMESNSKGDNTTFAHLDIHSSMDQLTWGTLNPIPMGDFTAYVKDIDENSATVEVDYNIATGEQNNAVYYRVSDRFRFIQGSDRMHLMDFYRDTEQIFSLSTGIINNNKIVLGITDEDVELVESTDGNQLAFVNAGRLYSYNVTDNKIAYVFGFYEDGNETEPRDGYRNNDIRVFDIDENGNIYFMVYGYMNRGIHEGMMGITVYYYDAIINNVEEKISIRYDKDYESLCRDIDTFSFANTSETGYVYMNDTIYKLDLVSGQCDVLVTGIPYKGLVRSDDHTMVAWVSGGDLYNATQIVMLNAVTNAQTYVEAEEDTRIMPIGFFGSDLLFGTAAKQNIEIQDNGYTLYPMDKIIIRNEKGDILKEYSESGCYIVSADMDDTMCSLERAMKTEYGMVPIAGDQLLNNKDEIKHKNNIETVAVDIYETITQIALRDPIDTGKMQILNPRQVIYEGSRTVVPENNDNLNEYRVYILGQLTNESIYSGDAIAEAYEGNGFVTDYCGRVIYKRSSLPSKNQIMAIEGTKAEEGETEEAVCLREMLSLCGKTVDTMSLLSDGMSAAEILRDNIEGAYILELSGIGLEADLYYIAKDISIMVKHGDGSSVLLIGYNEIAVVIMDPETGEVYKVDRDEVTKWIEGGSQFLTYVRCE